MKDSTTRPHPLEFEKPILELEGELAKMREKAGSQEIDLSDEIGAAEAKLDETRKRIYENLSPWQRVQIARHVDRPFMLDYLNDTFEDFCELHGDDPLDTDGWRFYVVSTMVLNQRLPNQKSIGVKPLINLHPTVSIYADLRQNIESVIVSHQES